jgi:hypothetical protein
MMFGSVDIFIYHLPISYQYYQKPCIGALAQLLGKEFVMLLMYNMDMETELRNGEHILQTQSASEAVEGAALSLESVDDVHSSNSLAPGMLGVGDCIPDDVLEESLNKKKSVP